MNHPTFRPEHFTVRYLLRFWKRTATERFGMNPNTANAVRVACARVLSVLGGKGNGPRARRPARPDGTPVGGVEGEDHDIRRLDLEDLKRRFQKAFEGSLSPETIETYKARFQYGVDAYLAFLKDPLGWDPGIEPRGRPAREADLVPDGAAGPGAAAMTHRFPLRKECDAVFTLPRDLTAAEAKRLAAFLNTLAGDFA